MDIIDRLLLLRRREHETTVEIIEALLACHRCRAHVDLGYRNLWVFMTERLEYSKAAASRRLRAVRCAAKFPVVIEWLRERRVNLSAVAKIAALLDEIDTADDLLARIEGRSEAEVEQVVAKARPVIKPAERVRTVFVKAGPVAARPMGSMFEQAGEPAIGPAVEPTAPTVEPRVCLSFSLSSEQFAAFERARAILSRRTGREPSIEECVVELVDLFLQKKAPKPRAGSARNQAAPRTRHIPAAVRDHVLLRDQERCTYSGPTGRRCGATTNLHIDHILPFALGGTHDPANLRVLCAEHNQRRAERSFGPAARTTNGARPGPRKRRRIATSQDPPSASTSCADPRPRRRSSAAARE